MTRRRGRAVPPPVPESRASHDYPPGWRRDDWVVPFQGGGACIHHGHDTDPDDHSLCGPTIHQLVGRSPAPGSGAEWREAFLAFAGGRTMSRSYKPVMLKAILRLVDREGEVDIDALAAEFRAYYVQRRLDGLPVEFNVPLLDEPAEVPLEQIKRLIITNPLERFIIQGFLQYDGATGMVRFAPELWAELRHADVLAILAAADEQLAYYYGRQRQG